MRAKLILTLAVAASILTACQNRLAEVLTCAAAETALAVYIADMEAGQTSSPQTIARAKSAAAFLSTYCGYVYADEWMAEPPKETSRSIVLPYGRPETTEPSFDGNGVVIVRRR